VRRGPIIALGLAAFAQPGLAEQDIWQVRVLRMEGAAVGVRRSAEAVGDVAVNIAESGRIQRLSDLKSKVEQLRRNVVSARLAAEVLHEGVTDTED